MTMHAAKNESRNERSREDEGDYIDDDDENDDKNVCYSFNFWFEWAQDSCLWSDDDATRTKFGTLCDLEELPLCQATRERAEEMCTWHDTADNWDQGECHRFYEASKDLYDTIVRELGDQFILHNTQQAYSPTP